MKKIIKTMMYSLSLALTLYAGNTLAAANEAVIALAKKEQPALLKTMKELVDIESGSAEFAGLEKIANLLAKKLQALGAKTELLDAGPEIYKMFDTPEKIGRMVRATFTGTGTRKILLVAHMDTVYPLGMLSGQPFKIEGDRAYGLGIADDKQGIAVILHTLTMLRSLNFREYGTLTVLINGDEEISSPASRALLTTSPMRAMTAPISG